MAFLDDLRDKTIDIAQAGVAKSKQLMELAKLTVSNAGEEDTIKKAYVEIGKLYYAERGMAPEAAYVALCEKVTQAKINIEENKARIAELKSQGDVKDEEVDAIIRDVPPEESAGGCSCCCGEEPPAGEGEDAPKEEVPPEADAGTDAPKDGE